MFKRRTKEEPFVVFFGTDVHGSDLQFLEPAQVTVLAERRRHSPYGLQGGEAGARGRTVLASGDKVEEIPAKMSIDVSPGDILSIQSPGGGGHTG